MLPLLKIMRRVECHNSDGSYNATSRFSWCVGVECQTESRGCGLKPTSAALCPRTPKSTCTTQETNGPSKEALVLFQYD